jgi:hypothetical protein
LPRWVQRPCAGGLRNRRLRHVIGHPYALPIATYQDLDDLSGPCVEQQTERLTPRPSAA